MIPWSVSVHVSRLLDGVGVDEHAPERHPETLPETVAAVVEILIVGRWGRVDQRPQLWEFEKRQNISPDLGRESLERAVVPDQ